MEKIPRLFRVIGPSDVPTEKQVPELIRVPADQRICGVVCSDAVFSLPTHFVSPRTRICPGQADCEWCGKVQLKWYGLLAVWNRNDHKAKWVQLTPQAVTSLLNQVAERQVPLLGLNIWIMRERKVKNAPILIGIDEYKETVSRLPKPMDPQETIERVFGSRDSTRSNGRKAV